MSDRRGACTVDEHPHSPRAASSEFTVTADSRASRSARVGMEGLADIASPETLETAKLLVSELASNVVRHTSSSEMTISIDVDTDRLHVVVDDSDNERFPHLAPLRPAEPGGMGLRLVDQLASAWGATSHEGGKSVWFELPLPG